MQATREKAAANNYTLQEVSKLLTRIVLAGKTEVNNPCFHIRFCLYDYTKTYYVLLA